MQLRHFSSLLANQLVASESQRARDHGQSAVVTPRVNLSFSFMSRFSRHLTDFIPIVIDIMYTVRKMKWSWAGHINRLKYDRWTSRVTTWRPYDKKRRQGRPAKRWRDDLDKYWNDTIRQRTAQDMLTWRRHAEAFAQPRDTTAA